MLLPIVAAVFLGAWGLPPSFQPQPAQGVEKQNQPAQHDASTEPSVEKQKTESDQRSGEKENEESREQNFVERGFKFVREYNAEIVTISTAIMALFTIGLFLSTYLLWRSGEKHSERELRAYVFVDASEVRHFGITQRNEGVICVKNTGQTPAYGLQAHGWLMFEKFPATNFQPHEWGEDTSCLGKDGTYTLHMSAGRRLTETERDQVISGESAIYIDCRFLYWDVFRKVERFTNYRGFFRGNGAPIAEGTSLSLTQTFESNDAN